MILVIGLDGAEWEVIRSNLNVLPNIRKLVEVGDSKTITLRDRPGTNNWCTMFSGKALNKLKHDLEINFIWDVLGDAFDVRALNVPIVSPPYNHNCDYTREYRGPPGPEELEEDLVSLTARAIEILEERPDVFIVVYTVLDKLIGLCGGTPILEWYKKIDARLGELLQYMEQEDKLLLILNPGVCNSDKPRGAVLITRNVSSVIDSPQSVFHAIRAGLDLSLEEKVEISLGIIEKALSRFKKPAVAWTTGKNSTAVLGLLREASGTVPCVVLHADTTVNFRETYKFRDRLVKDWNLNLVVVRPEIEIPADFRIAEDREKCCHLLKTMPMKKKIRELGVDGVFTGRRWDEHDAGAGGRYFSEHEGYCDISPILHWSEEDVWNYLRSRWIPHNPLYDKGYRNISCEPCTRLSPSRERSSGNRDKEEVMERLSVKYRGNP